MQEYRIIVVNMTKLNFTWMPISLVIRLITNHLLSILFFLIIISIINVLQTICCSLCMCCCCRQSVASVVQLLASGFNYCRRDYFSYGLRENEHSLNKLLSNLKIKIDMLLKIFGNTFQQIRLLLIMLSQMEQNTFWRSILL